MPWSVYNSNGKLLQSLAIGDDSIVEGKLDVSNAPTNGYFLQAQSAEGGGLTWAAVVATSAVTREGGNTTEATTTSTSDADMFTVSSLTIAVTEPYTFMAGLRRTTGATVQSGVGLKVNSTTTRGSFAWMHTTINFAAEALYKVEMAPRVANYLQASLLLAIPSGGNHVHGSGFDNASRTAAAPTVTITSLTVIGNTASGSVTMGADEGQVYSWSAS